jgi:hypothetical protein
MNAKLSIDVGSVSTLCGKMMFSVNVHSTGEGHVQIYAYDPSDLRKSGVMLVLGEDQYTELRSVLEDLDHTIQKLQANGQMQPRLGVRLD